MSSRIERDKNCMILGVATKIEFRNILIFLNILLLLGWREAKTVMYFMEQRKTELVIVRSGAKGSNQTTYLIYPK